MKIGTKSLLFGAHQFIIHPIIVFIAWWKLYGFPFDPRLWVAFIVHDWGYWGKSNMDGDEGEIHVFLGADIMHKLFDRKHKTTNIGRGQTIMIGGTYTWYNFTLFHSRFYAKKNNHPISKLCVADKYAIVLDPWWFYLIRASLSSEIKEYRDHHYKQTGELYITNKHWLISIKTYLNLWVIQHKNNLNDTWTKNNDLSPDGTIGFHETIKRELYGK